MIGSLRWFNVFDDFYLFLYFFYLETIMVQTETMTDPEINTTIGARMNPVKNGSCLHKG
jgi:hypothetical protein